MSKTIDTTNLKFVIKPAVEKLAKDVYYKPVQTAPEGYEFTGEFKTIDLFKSDETVYGSEGSPYVAKDFTPKDAVRLVLKKLNSEKVENKGTSILFKFKSHKQPSDGEYYSIGQEIFIWHGNKDTYSGFYDVYEKILL